MPTPSVLLGISTGAVNIDGEKASKWKKHEDGNLESLSEENSEKLTKLHGSDNWYDWRIRNWGVKWNVSECRWEQLSSNTIRYEFDTPWGPPHGIVGRLYQLFPEKELGMTWFYDEPGMEVAGYLNRGDFELIKETPNVEVKNELK